MSVSLRESLQNVCMLHTYIRRYAVLQNCVCIHMGWLRLVGSFKSQVSFAKEPYKRDYSAKETYDIKEPTNRRYPIGVCPANERVRSREVGGWGGVPFSRIS